MKKILLGAAAIGAVLAMSAPAQARDDCGPGGHRGPHDHCRPNHGGWDHGRGPGRDAWVEGRFYPGHGYWSQGRWWQHRDRDHGHHRDWRYR